MRILTILHNLTRGGIEIALLSCFPHLIKRGFQMDICCTGARQALDPEFERMGCRIFRIPKIARPLANFWQLYRLLGKYPYDLVHTHFGYTSGGILMAASFRRIPAIVSLHSIVPTSLYHWNYRPVLGHIRNAGLRMQRRIADRYATFVVGHSRANLDSYLPTWENKPGRYRVVELGIPFSDTTTEKSVARRRLGICESDLVLLHVGSYSHPKNHRGLLEIAKRVIAVRKDTLLLMLGKNTFEIKPAARRMGIIDHVRCEEPQPPWPFYHASDVFVFPSIVEGFGMVLAEAQSANLPIVASDILSHRESVAPMQHRFLFPLPDYDQAAKLILDQHRATIENKNPWISASREYVRSRFTPERMAKDLADLYSSFTAGLE